MSFCLIFRKRKVRSEMGLVSREKGKAEQGGRCDGTAKDWMAKCAEGRSLAPLS